MLQMTKATMAKFNSKEFTLREIETKDGVEINEKFQTLNESKIKCEFFEPNIPQIRFDENTIQCKNKQNNTIMQSNEKCKVEKIEVGDWADLNVVAESEDEENEENTSQDKSKQEWYTCKLCVYQSLTVKILINHMMRKHTLNDSGFYDCGFCQHKESSEELLRIHLRQDHVPTKAVVNNSWRLALYVEKKKDRRVRFLSYQRDVLENVYRKQRYLTPEMKRELAVTLDISEKQVAEWFRNKRKKCKKL